MLSGGANSRGRGYPRAAAGVSAIRDNWGTAGEANRETFARPMTLLFGDFNGVGIYLIDARISVTDRVIAIMTSRWDYPDNVLRFALLSWVAARLAGGLDPFWRPEIVHAHDWHAGLTPAYLAARGNPARSVFYGAQHCLSGLVPRPAYGGDRFTVVILPDAGWSLKGRISFLKAASISLTISPPSARRMPVKLPNRSTRSVWKSCCGNVSGKGDCQGS